MPANEGFDRTEKFFSEPEYAAGAVQQAADDAVADLVNQIAWIKANLPKAKEAMFDLATKTKERFPDATFGTVFNTDPDERWQFDVVSEVPYRDVLDFIWESAKKYKDLGIYPVPRTSEEAVVA